jgi:hypothetical protein
MDNIIVYVVLMIDGSADYILLCGAVRQNFFWGFFSDLRLACSVKVLGVFIGASMCDIFYFYLIIVIEYVGISVVLLTFLVGSVALLIFNNLWGKNMLLGFIHFQ